MLWKDRNGKMHSTTNLLPKTNTDVFFENAKECAKITGNLNLFEEMSGEDPYNERGQDSAFMDDNFGVCLMQTTTATYSIQVTTPGGHLSFLKDMPTRPKTQRGIKSQNNKLSKWVEKCYPDFTSYDIILLDS